MGVLATAKVVTGSGRRGRPFFTQPGNREWVTVIESVNSQGWAIPPMILFEGKVHLSTWYKETQLPADWVIGVSENGWTNNELGLIWLKDVFDKYTKSRTIGRYRLLILDGHKSHCTAEFDQYCMENSIIPLCMPPHSSHILQPLDVGCFSPLKNIYGGQVEANIRLGVNHIDKPEFLTIYQTTRTQALSSSNICSGFAATGLVPYSPERVLSGLNIQIRTPTPPLIPTDSENQWVSETPHNLTQLQRQAEVIKGLILARPQSPQSPTSIALDQLVKGCQIAMQSAALLVQENIQLHAANNKQKRKRASTRSYIATGGVLTVEEGIERSGLVEIKQQRAEVGNSEPKRRAPSRCSVCKSKEHTARTCPLRYINE
ncbi:Pogo transposable element [Thalictrum thalictroides]|uniref:Pogo transposable element n=1 Tax=Thalictrum thalictroides TaxID=46969 RepID=A0A7J6WZ05_THATH|nr:Pogo transposable element [Thalictrum thalictroides]